MPRTDTDQVFTAQQVDATDAVHSWAALDSRHTAAIAKALQRHYQCDWGIASYEDAVDADIAVTLPWDVESAYLMGEDNHGRSLLLMVTTPRFGTSWSRRRLTSVRFTTDIERAEG